MTMHILPPNADNFSIARQACRLAKGPIISALRLNSQAAGETATSRPGSGQLIDSVAKWINEMRNELEHALRKLVPKGGR